MPTLPRKYQPHEPRVWMRQTDALQVHVHHRKRPAVTPSCLRAAGSARSVQIASVSPATSKRAAPGRVTSSRHHQRLQHGQPLLRERLPVSKSAASRSCARPTLGTRACSSSASVLGLWSASASRIGTWTASFKLASPSAPVTLSATSPRGRTSTNRMARSASAWASGVKRRAPGHHRRSSMCSA